MSKKLDGILERYEKLNELLLDPAVISNIDEYKKYAKELSGLEETVEKYKELKRYREEKELAEQSYELESDLDMKDLLYEEVKELKGKIETAEAELKILLIPKDPDDDKNVIVEIRAGAGGEEAALFAYELYRMYVNYADKKRWKSEEIDSNPTELGGL